MQEFRSSFRFAASSPGQSVVFPRLAAPRVPRDMHFGSVASAPRGATAARLEALRTMSLVRGASEQALLELAEASALRRFARGRRLTTAGTRDECAILVRGRAKMMVPRGRADGELVLEIFTDGDVLSESCWVRHDRVFSGETVALEPSVVLFVPRLAIEHCFATDEDVAIALIERIADRLARGSTLAMQNACMPAADRLYCRLSELSLTHGRSEDGALVIEHGLSQRELAGFSAASREIVNRVLSGWKDRGWIAIRRHAIVVRDVAALAQAVSPDARRVGFGNGDGRSPIRRRGA